LAPTDEHSRFVAGGPSGRTHVHIVRSKDVAGALPVIVYLHGGGWMMGSFKTHERLVRTLSHGVGATVVFVDYYRTPEARVPISIEQSYAVLKYLSEHPVELDIDASRFAHRRSRRRRRGGMLTALTMLAKKRGGPKIRRQILLHPLTSAKFDNASYKEFAEGPWLMRDDMKWF
jgi:acetyl esterase